MTGPKAIGAKNQRNVAPSHLHLRKGQEVEMRSELMTTNDYVGYISFYYSLDEEYPVPEREPGFSGSCWTWGRYGIRKNESCCRCNVREGLVSLVGREGAPVYYITNWRGKRYLTGRMVWSNPKKTVSCSGNYSDRNWCWAYRSKNVKFIFPKEFDEVLYLKVFEENHVKSSHIRVKKIRKKHALRLNQILMKEEDCTALCEELYLKLTEGGSGCR